MIKTDGVAKISSSVTGKVHEVEPSDLDWDAVGGDERGMGTETLYEAVVQVEDHGVGKVVTCTWTASEYPVGALSHVTAVVENGSLDQDFSFSWEHHPGD
jgi:hypothetical protein